MSTSISRIPLFDYEGRYKYAQRIDTNAQFQTAPSDFNPGYSVNGAPTGDQIGAVTQYSYGLNNAGQIARQTPASTSSLMGYGQDTFSSTTNQTVAGVTSGYTDWMGSLENTDQRMTQLLAQDQFDIYNGRVGMRVTTDGSSNIDTVSLLGTNRDQRNGLDPKALSVLDRTDITTRAASREGNTLFNGQSQTDSGLSPFKRVNGAQNKNLNANTNTLTQRNAVQGVEKSLGFPGLGVRETPAFKPEGLTNNPFAKAVLQNSQMSVTTPVFGVDSTLTADQARNLAAVKSNFGVQHSVEVKDAIALMKERQALDATVGLSQKILRARDGLIPGVFQSNNSGQTGMQMGYGNPSQGLDHMSMNSDSLDKKSSGGYIPFNMGQSSGEGTQQEQRRQRRPLRVMA